MDSKSISKALGIRQEQEKDENLDIANDPNDDDEEEEEIAESEEDDNGISGAMDVGDIGEAEVPTRYIYSTVLSNVVPGRNRRNNNSNNNALSATRAYLFSVLILFQNYV